MTAFWFAVAGLVVLTLALLLRPLLRPGQPPPDRGEYDLAVFRDQLAELDRDVGRGVIGLAEADAARLEIQRRMLAAAPAENTESTPPPPPRRGVALGIGVAVPAFAFAMYLSLGAPGLPGAPFASRVVPETGAVAARGDVDRAAVEQAMTQVRARLEASPDDRDAWVLLGRALLAAGRAEEAVVVYQRLVTVDGAASDVQSGLGEALTAVAGGRVTEDARTAFARALDADLLNPRARYYLALSKAQQGDVRGAMQDWVDLAVLSPPDAPWLPLLQRQIVGAAGQLGVDPATLRPSAPIREALARVRAADDPPATPAPGPRADEVAAAAEMAPEDRQAMILGMVQRLADRLQEQPDDRDGWLRLARAYEVLGEAEKAREARARAAALENAESPTPSE